MGSSMSDFPFRNFGDDRRAYVAPLTFGRGRICVGDRHDDTGYQIAY